MSQHRGCLGLVWSDRHPVLDGLCRLGKKHKARGALLQHISGLTHPCSKEEITTHGQPLFQGLSIRAFRRVPWLAEKLPGMKLRGACPTRVGVLSLLLTMAWLVEMMRSATRGSGSGSGCCQLPPLSADGGVVPYVKGNGLGRRARRLVSAPRDVTADHRYRRKEHESSGNGS